MDIAPLQREAEATTPPPQPPPQPTPQPLPQPLPQPTPQPTPQPLPQPTPPQPLPQPTPQPLPQPTHGLDAAPPMELENDEAALQNFLEDENLVVGIDADDMGTDPTKEFMIALSQAGHYNVTWGRS